jgi:Holliday junction resolvasome RuvABC endonuclease subunit
VPRAKLGRSRKQRTPRPTKHRTRGPARRKAQPVAPVGGVTRVLALDSSSRACGWSIFDNGALLVHGCYRQTGTGHGERLMNFRAWLLGMLQEWAPHVVIYEAPYQGRMKNTYGILSRYVGIIESAHFEHYGREFDKDEAVAAHLVKRAIGAKKGTDHEANKKIVLLMVNQQFGLNLKFKANDTTKKITQDDEADAIALNWAWHLMRERQADTVDEAA